MKAGVAAFNQEKALVGAFSVITNLRVDIRFKLYSAASSSSDRDHQLVPSVGVTININNDINSPPPGAQCCYDKFTGCNCGDPRLIYLHIFRCPLSRVMLVIITGEQKP